MALDAQKALQLSALLAQSSTLFTQNNPGQNEFARHLLGSAQAGIQAEALKKAKKEEEKKKKGLFGGSIGSALGTAAGIALAPVTGGASMAIAGGLGGALGGAAGTALGGGSISPSQTLGYGLQGGMQGYQYGKAGQLSQSAVDGAVAPPPVGEQIGADIKRTIPPVQAVAAPSTYPTSPVNTPAMAALPPANMQPRPAVQGLGQRFMGALGHTTGINPAQYRPYRFDDGDDGIRTYWSQG